MFRIGVLGTGSTHVDEFLRHINDEQRFPGLRIGAVLAESTERDAQLASHGLQVLPEVSDVVAASDGILVTHRQGSRHPALAEPGLAAGLPTFVDKPLATRISDADGLVRLATQHGTPLGSCSVLRLQPLVVAARDLSPSEVVVRGPANQNSPYDGLFFYGIHAAEAACAVALGGGVAALPENVTASREGGAVFIEATLDGCVVRLVVAEQTSDFSLGTGDGPQTIDLGPDYLTPVSIVIADVMRGGPVPDLAPTLAAISLLEQAEGLLG